VTGVGPELEHFHYPGSYTLTTLPLFCFRVRLDNLRQKKTNRIPPVRAVMSHWYSIQEEFYYIMARVEIHSVLQPRNVITSVTLKHSVTGNAPNDYSDELFYN
jgi:hypothetical protein